MAQIGRPTKFTQDIADIICDELSNGVSLRTVCLSNELPDKRTVFRWLRENEEFRHQYEKAKDESTDAMAEDLLDISDNGTNDWMEKERDDGSTYTVLNSENIQRSRLRVDTRKWLMAKMKPKKYGEKLDVVSDGEKLEAGGILGYVLPALTVPEPQNDEE